MKKEKGQIMVFAALLFPAFTALIIFAVNFGFLIFFELKLQMAADRAALAGALRLAEIMNGITEENKIINDAFLNLEKNFKSNSQQSIGECEARVAEMKNIQGEALQNIETMLVSAYEDANAAASEAAQGHFPDVRYETLFGLPGDRLFSVGDVRKDIVCGNIKGAFVDPSNVESKNNQGLLEYLYSNREYVALACRISFDFRPPFMKGLFGDSPIEAVSAAQPYGGSISPFILQNQLGPFEATLVPVRTVLRGYE